MAPSPLLSWIAEVVLLKVLIQPVDNSLRIPIQAEGASLCITSCFFLWDSTLCLGKFSCTLLLCCLGDGVCVRIITVFFIYLLAQHFNQLLSAMSWI